MPDSTPTPSPATRPYCDECAKYGKTHGDAKAGMAAVRAADREGRRRAAHRRTRVLAHPDIAQALTEPPLSYRSPERWEGHIPPAWIPTKHGWKPNKTAIRAALITICEYVAAREAEQAAAQSEDA